jgi:uncharacterized membrane protein YsdA (DUF1294 family)
MRFKNKEVGIYMNCLSQQTFHHKFSAQMLSFYMKIVTVKEYLVLIYQSCFAKAIQSIFSKLCTID